MKRLPSVGIALLALAFTLTTQELSIAGSQETASTDFVPETAVPQETDAVTEEENHTASAARVRPRKRFSSTPLRRVISGTALAQATLVPAPAETPMLAAIDRSDAEMRHKRIANEALHALPARCRETLQNFYVKYEKQEHRGLAGKSVMILDGTVRSDKEFRALFIHESGHNWDLGCLTGSNDAGKSAFSDGDEPIYENDPSLGFYRISWITSQAQRSDARPEDFVSGYASYDIFEDFAESFAYFVLHNEEFAKRAETNAILGKKYAWFRDTLFDGGTPSVATGNAPFKKKVPWDITKLDYAWHPREAYAKR